MAIAEIIKYNGGKEDFIWKFPNEEIGTWSQLIVNETQEAILLKDGKICDSFNPGRYTLDTLNIPILNKLINIPFGNKSPFKAEVFFVNKLHILDIKWGTVSPIQIQDPKYKIYVSLRSFGQFGVKIDNSTIFFKKLVGTNKNFSKDELIVFFRGIYLTKIKDTISSYLVNKNISILEINAYLEELSLYIQKKLEPFFKEYGIEMLNFYINDINFPDDDESIKKLKDALSKRAEMDIVGYSYVQERSFDTLEGAATNNSGNLSNDFINAGIGITLGNSFGNVIGKNIGSQMDIIGETKQSGILNCAVCGKSFDGNANFCPHCGGAQKKICSKCGAIQSNNEAKFCYQCGNSLKKKCPNCDAILEENGKFCSCCGHKIGG